MLADVALCVLLPMVELWAEDWTLALLDGGRGWASTEGVAGVAVGSRWLYIW